MPRFEIPKRYLDYLPAIAVVLAVFISTGAIRFVGPTRAIKVSFLAIGSGLCWIAYVTTSHGGKLSSTDSNQWLIKGTVALLLATFPAAVFVHRLIALFVIVPLVLGLLLVQVRSAVPSTHILGQSVTLFATVGCLRYLTTGLYAANGDPITHLIYAKSVASTGSLDSITSIYNVFPGYHVIVAVVAEILNISVSNAAEVVMIAGAITFMTTLGFAAIRIMDSGIARRAVVISPLAVAPFYNDFFIFWSQGIAVVFIAVLFYVSVRLSQTGRDKRFVMIWMVVSTALIVTHHLTVLLLATVVGLLLVEQISRSVVDDGDRFWPGSRIFGVTVLCGFGYWIMVREFFAETIFFAMRLAAIELDSSARTGGGFVFGLTLASETMRSALRWLIHPAGLYAISLTAILIAAGITILRADITLDVPMTIVGIGFVTCILYLPLPPSINLKARFKFVFGMFAILVIALGIQALLSREGKSRLGSAVPVVIVILLLVTAPLSAIDGFGSAYDENPKNAIDSLSNRLTQATTERTLSDGEFQQLRESAKFGSQHTPTMSTMYRDKMLITLFGMQRSQIESPNVGSDGIKWPTDILLVRDGWADYRTPVNRTGIYSPYLLTDEAWLASLESDENKIYASGEISLQYNEQGDNG